MAILLYLKRILLIAWSFYLCRKIPCILQNYTVWQVPVNSWRILNSWRGRAWFNVWSMGLYPTTYESCIWIFDWVGWCKDGRGNVNFLYYLFWAILITCFVVGKKQPHAERSQAPSPNPISLMYAESLQNDLVHNYSFDGC